MEQQTGRQGHPLVDTPAAIKMRKLRANPIYVKVKTTKASLKRLHKLVSEYEVMSRQHPGLIETQQVHTARICVRQLQVEVVRHKYNYSVYLESKKQCQRQQNQQN